MDNPVQPPPAAEEITSRIQESDLDEKSRTGLCIVGAAVLLGLLADALLRATPWGLNVFLWTLGLGWAMVGVMYIQKRQFAWPQLALLGVAFWFAVSFAWRDSPVLKLLDALAMAAALALATAYEISEETPLRRAGFTRYGIAGFLAGLYAVGGIE